MVSRTPLYISKPSNDGVPGIVDSISIISLDLLSKLAIVLDDGIRLSMELPSISCLRFSIASGWNPTNVSTVDRDIVDRNLGNDEVFSS